MTTAIQIAKAYECRVYENTIGNEKNEVEPGKPVNRVGFIIQQRYYGDSLQDYVRLFKFAQKFFPHLKLSDIVLGKVSNTGSFDGHAVISFGIKSSWELTNKFHKRFKKYTGFLDFRY